TELDMDLAPQVKGAGATTHEADTGFAVGRRKRYGELRGKAAEGGIQGLYAYPRRLRLGHAEALEDVQRLPEKNPRGIGAPGAERRFRDAFEDFGFLVGVTDLPGQPEHGVVLADRLVVAARGAAYVGDPAHGDDLLGVFPDLLGDQPGLLMVHQRIVVALRLAVEGTEIIEHVRLVGQVADLAVNGQGPLIGGQRLLVAALVVVDPADVVIQDRLVLRSANL